MKIINNTNLSYEKIGKAIDQIIDNTQGTTHYVGQVEYTTMEFKNVVVKIQIRYLKSFVEWRFDLK